MPALLSLAMALISCAPPAETLTPERLAEARSLWRERGPDTYVLALEMRGAINERRRVEVEAGIVMDMTAGDSPAARSAWDSWSVEGLLELLERELANAADSATTYGIEDSSRILLEALFDPQLGYPIYFRREVPGVNPPIEWEVVDFETP